MQVEVLAEMHAGVPTEVDQLEKYLHTLREAIVSLIFDADRYFISFFSGYDLP